MFSWRSKMMRLSALTLILIAGCTSHGSQFLGKWVNTKNQHDTMEIVRNGEGYLIQADGTKIGAIYKDGTLQVQGMLGRISLTYVKATDTIEAPGFFGQAEYKRQR
jgi:hypothetical protein